MKTVFNFALKALLVFKIFKFFSGLFGYVGDSLIRNKGLISKFMTSQSGKQTIVIHILPNISRRKCNQKIKFDQLIKENMRNNFHEKPCRKCGTETLPRTTPKKWKLSVSLDHWSKLWWSLFLKYAKLRAIELYWN